MFVDSVVLTISAGNGGNGVVAWRREKFIPKGGPSGGNGGKGASVYVQASTSIAALEAYRNKRIIRADNGQAGGGNLKQGKDGKDLILLVPPGTLVKDARSGAVLFDLIQDGQKVLLCAGGKGGKGNHHFRSPTHQAPNVCTKGNDGQAREVQLELKLIADVGLIGMPNAGKSTLLTQLTEVQVKIGAYPFTTLQPNLSYIYYQNFQRILLADIPGLIENAHLNKGLGFAFLKHVERTTALLYVIDVSGFEGRDPWEDYCTLQEELRAYDERLLSKPCLIALNKTDIEGAAENIEKFLEKCPIPRSDVFCISALNAEGLLPLIERLRTLFPYQPPVVEEEEIFIRADEYCDAELIETALT